MNKNFSSKPWCERATPFGCRDCCDTILKKQYCEERKTSTNFGQCSLWWCLCFTVTYEVFASFQNPLLSIWQQSKYANTFMSCVAGLRIAKTARRRIASHGMILGFETRRAIKTFFQCRRSFVWSVEVLVGPDYCTSEDWVSQWGSVLSIVQDPITQALWQDDRTCINIFVKCAIAILVKKWKMVLLKNRQKFELRPSKCWISEWSRKYCSCFWAS